MDLRTSFHPMFIRLTPPLPPPSASSDASSEANDDSGEVGTEVVAFPFPQLFGGGS